MNIPHPEHPKMQLRRDNWQNLNGIWQFEIDNGRSGESRGLPQKGTRLSGEIVVPFCPKSMLSGIGHTNFMYGVCISAALLSRKGSCAVWYACIWAQWITGAVCISTVSWPDPIQAAMFRRSMAMGFNSARLHQKVFEERFLYHCDRRPKVDPAVIRAILPQQAAVEHQEKTR